MEIVQDRIKEFQHAYDVKVAISAINATLVPLRSKIHAREFVQSKHPRVVVQKIYEEGFPVETGAVISCLYKSRYDEYVHLMGEETRYQQHKELLSKGDGLILK